MIPRYGPDKCGLACSVTFDEHEAWERDVLGIPQSAKN